MTTETPAERIEVRSQVDDAEWEELLARDDRSSLFQHPRWNRRYVDHHPGTAALWIESRDTRGSLQGGLGFVQRTRVGFKALSSGVGGTYAGPVVAGRDANTEAGLLQRFLDYGGWAVVRRELVWGNEAPPALPEGYSRPIEAAGLHTDVSFEEFLRDRFPKNRRNECNRSERRGLSAEVTRDDRVLQEFLPVYTGQASRWGVKAESGEYLRAILREEDDAIFFVTRYEGDVVGGHLCFRLPDQLFAWTGTTRRLESLFPSSLLIKVEAEFACDHGLPLLNLGSSLGLSGVANYKRLLGAHTVRRWLLHRESRPLAWWRNWTQRRNTD